MKVLHINCNYLTTVLHQTMIEALDKTGVESIVFAPTCNTSKSVVEPKENVIVSQCFKKIDRVSFFHKQRKILRNIEKLDIFQFDCFHAYTVFTDGNSAMELSKKYHIPYIVAVRNTDVNTFFKYMPHLRERGIEILEKASAVMFLSPTYMETVMSKYVPEEKRKMLLRKSYIIPNGINDVWFSNGQARDFGITLERFRQQELKVIYVGRIDRNKNITTTQKALSILRKEGWHIGFTVVGGVDDKREYKRITKDEYTTCLPKKSMKELVEIYRGNDIFIMPSHAESFGLVYAESMSQGLPVIYTKGQGFDGQFPDGEVGFAVDDKDAGSIAEAIEKIANRYEEISTKAIEGSKKFRWDDICEIYKQIYNCIVSENG